MKVVFKAFGQFPLGIVKEGKLFSYFLSHSSGIVTSLGLLDLHL